MGFIWETGKGITLDEFFTHLAKLKDTPIRFANYDRLLYVGTRGGYHVGLFLKIKDQRRSPEIMNDSGVYKISVRELNEGSNLCDFNFFAINKATGRGMYQHYHQSCSLNQFGIFCQRQYEDLRQEKVDGELVPLGGDSAGAKDKLRIESKYKGTLTWENMVRPESLDKLLEELAKIKFFEFNATAITAQEPLVGPLSKFAKREKRSFRFSPTADSDGLRGAIVHVVKTGQILRGRVGGVDAEDRERVFRLIENPDTFGEYEYDEIADETTLNVKQVEKSPFFDLMLGKIEGDPKIKAMFETP